MFKQLKSELREILEAVARSANDSDFTDGRTLEIDEGVSELESLFNKSVSKGGGRMSNKDKTELLNKVFDLVNTLANLDDTMIGSEEYRAYHYRNALELLLHHYDPKHDIRWLEPLYEEIKEQL